MAKEPRTPSVAPASRALAADTLPGGAAAPAGSGGPRITVDADAPTDPVIRSETEQLRDDAAASGREPEGDGAESAAGRQDSPVGDAPVSGLGDAASRTPEALGVDFGRDRILSDAPAARHSFTRASDRNAIGVTIAGVADNYVQILGSLPVDLEGMVHKLLYFVGAYEYEAEAVQVSPTLLLLFEPEIKPAPGVDALVLTGTRAAGVGSMSVVYPLPQATGPDQVPLAAPAVQPTAVVDPAFVRVAASAKVLAVSDRVLKVNTQIRSEPDHFYGVRYVDVDGAPRIVRIEAFVGPTDSFTLAGDFLPPLKGSDVQLGVLSTPVDIETGQRLTPEGFLSIRPTGDGAAIAVTVDGRKIRVGLLP